MTTLVSLPQVREQLAAAIALSPADETSVVWVETWRKRCGEQMTRRSTPRRRRWALVRVQERGRFGWQEAPSLDHGDLALTIRLALAQARLATPQRGMLHLPEAAGETVSTEGLFDETLASLEQEEATELIRGELEPRETATFEWGAGHVVVADSRGADRSTRVTSVSVEARSGTGRGCGRARRAARRLERLDLPGLVARARGRRATSEEDDLPDSPTRALLAPEALAQLVDVLNRTALTATSFVDGSSFLREYLGVQVFHRDLTIVDDAGPEHPLSLPFDFEGAAKQRVTLVDRGMPRTPALDQLSAALLGLQSTGHAAARGEGRAEHLVVLPGPHSRAELLARAEGGVFVAAWDRLECFDPPRMQVRGVARGVRRIVDGELGPGLPDLLWEGSLLRAFGELDGIGSQLTVTAGPDPILGGLCCPAVVLGDFEGFALAPPRG